MQGQRVKASVFGYHRQDATVCLQKAIYSRFDTIIIEKQFSPWNIGPLVLRKLKNKTILFEKGVVVKAIAGKFGSKNACLFLLEECENLSIIGSQGVLSMNKREYIDGEWRHALSIRKSKNIRVQDLIIEDSGGDGIYIAGKEKGTYSSDIRLKNIISRNNKRQGMSIVSAQNVKIENCVFKKTNGTLPEAGVDIEPNTKQDRIVNVHFSKCSFVNNHHSGILLALDKLEKESRPISIVFEDCYISRNHVTSNTYVPTEIFIGANKEKPVLGTVLFKNCLVKDSDWGMLYSRKRNDAFKVSFENCAAIDICKKGVYPPISFEVSDYIGATSSLGGFSFKQLYVSYSVKLPIISVRGSQLGTLQHLKDVKGQFIITDYNEGINLMDYIQYNKRNNEGVFVEVVKQSN
ncbi:right-handed parallel beta-helix repeat-containing protein [Maribacter sp.]|uniref:right-handed parallel beta-helix repeat-containing protein n=1 Tax=Maribacter sp. TaxID=1897614 RepID=UPI0025C2B5A5|nr:right-handed parallel beta-helix repeat-containing protein [Maribacter sp.]